MTSNAVITVVMPAVAAACQAVTSSSVPDGIADRTAAIAVQKVRRAQSVQSIFSVFTTALLVDVVDGQDDADKKTKTERRN